MNNILQINIMCMYRNWCINRSQCQKAAWRLYDYDWLPSFDRDGC